MLNKDNFWPASSLGTTRNLQLELLQWLHSKTGCGTLQMYFAVTSINSLLTGAGWQGHLFIITTYATGFSSSFLHISMLLSSFQLHTMPLITQYLWCTCFSFILCYLRMKKKGERIWYKIKLLTNYCQIMLWATCDLKKKYEWITENPLTGRKTTTIMTGN